METVVKRNGIEIAGDHAAAVEVLPEVVVALGEFGKEGVVVRLDMSQLPESRVTVSGQGVEITFEGGDCLVRLRTGQRMILEEAGKPSYEILRRARE